VSNFFGVLPIQRLAQTFVAGRSGLLTGIELALRWIGTPDPSAVFTLTLYAGSGALLGSATVPGTGLPRSSSTPLGPGAPDAAYFDLSALYITVNAGASYQIRIVSSGSAGAGAGAAAGNPYAAGAASGLNDLSSFDLAFQTYVR
jgi:hypothetical protein